MGKRYYFYKLSTKAHNRIYGKAIRGESWGGGTIIHLSVRKIDKHGKFYKGVEVNVRIN